MFINGVCRNDLCGRELSGNDPRLPINLYWRNDVRLTDTCDAEARPKCSASGCEFQFSILGRGDHAVCRKGKRRLLVGYGWKEIYRLPYGIWSHHFGSFV